MAACRTNNGGTPVFLPVFASVPISSNGGRLLDIEQWRAGVILPVLPPFLPVFHRCRVELHNAHTATLAEGMKHYWCRCSRHRWKVCPNTVPDGTVAYAVPPETGSGTWDCWIVYPKLILRDGRLRCPTGTASGFIWVRKFRLLLALEPSTMPIQPGEGSKWQIMPCNCFVMCQGLRV